MSKKLEAEYQKLAQDDFPDLWERIEAGLTAKPDSAPTVSSDSTPKTIDEIPLSPVSRSVRKSPVRKLPGFKKYAGPLAACLCLILLIPVVLRLNRAVGHSSAEDSAGAPQAPAAMNEEAAVDVAAAEEELMPEAAAEADMESSRDEAATGEITDMDTGASEINADEASESVMEEEEAGRAESADADSDKAAGAQASLAGLWETDSARITAAEVKLLLETPAAELNRYLTDLPDGQKLKGPADTVVSSIPGVEFGYGTADASGQESNYPTAVYIWYEGKRGTVFPLGYTIEEVLASAEWGKTQVRDYPADHSSGSTEAGPLKELQYEKDGLHYTLRSGYQNRYDLGDKQEQTITMIMITD